ncbi:hypothetical protein HNR42_001903 [Deinobacterium chartae]|uniref:Secreted protein n=1 Tax=Deinobacterium chartae TaxID=521158 RepID=A0A841I259_9DEIO|nr:hypothetical protein [Deinobacterium chartae]MBB6098469.1 hypothetical protein [Deinobacterium chartae]
MKNLLMTLMLLSASAALAEGSQLPVIGGQRDAHGCLSAAGQSWSVLKKACVQPWNVADVRLTDPRNPQLAVYVLFSQDGKQAELVGRQSVLHRVGAEYVSADGLTHLVRNGQTWSLNPKETPIGGGQDEHGCRPSAGTTWSALRGECVQVFNVADIRLTDPKNPTLGVFVLLSADKKTAELFGLGYESGVMLTQTAKGYASADGKVQLEQAGKGWTLK